MAENELDARAARREGPEAEYLRVFDALRARPGRWTYALTARMERRAALRKPPGRHDGLQRGDAAEPPPVLDLAVERPEDREPLVRSLVARCGLQPVWRLPDISDAPGTAPEAPAGEDASQEPHATTDELYDLVEHLVEDGFSWPEDQESAPSRRKPPPPPRFAHVRSLLWLRRCHFADLRADLAGTEVAPPEHSVLENGSQAHIRVIAELRRVRLERARRERRAPESRVDSLRDSAVLFWRHIAVGVSRLSAWAARTATRITFDRVNEKILTPLAFVVSLIVTAAPFAFLQLLAQQAQQANSIVGVLAGTVLSGCYTVLAFFLLLPWRPYRWLRRHRYVVWDTDGAGQAAHADQPDEAAESGEGETGEAAPGGREPTGWKAQPGHDGFDIPADHRERGVHVLNQLNTESATVGHVGPGDRPPGIHRLIVNALLDDLHLAYGSAGWWRLFTPRRERSQRPVLVFDQERTSRVARYLVRMVEDERLRRGYPDPLLLVQVRDGASAPLVDGSLDVERYLTLPEGRQRTEERGGQPERKSREDSAPEVRRWRRLRYATGGLGVDRLVRQKVPPPMDGWPAEPWRPGPAWVRTVPALVGNWAAGVAAVTAGAVFASTVIIQAVHPCVQDGAFVPDGITLVKEDGAFIPDDGITLLKGECVGLTYGDFVFNDRLEEVTDLIHEQNREVDKEVDKSGVPYVTVVYLAELNVADDDDPSLSGAQGELLGLAYQQNEHNKSAESEGKPQIKLLLGNAGVGWRHADVTAQEIVDRVEDESLGVDRPVAAVGFGRSVAPNSEAITTVGDAQLPMVGTTATFDDVSKNGNRRHSEFFFPIAPSNTRIAAQAAHWAYNGVPWQSSDGQNSGLEPARTAVAITNVAEDEKGEEHDRYGTDLAEKFIRAFQDLGGRAWEAPDHLGEDEYADGTLLYAPGTEDTATLTDQMWELCTNDPPDLVYFAGRSADFDTFYRDVRQRCEAGEITILGGDDIAKFVTDDEPTISNAAAFPVFYTPLARVTGVDPAKDPQDLKMNEDEAGFYTDMVGLVKPLYLDGEDREDSGPATDNRLPSIAHAAVAADALLVVSKAMPTTGLTNKELKARLSFLGLGGSPFLREPGDYEDWRGELFGEIKCTDNLIGMTGYIRFDPDVDGNWYPDRMVRLALVGPERGEERQHVIAQGGQLSADPPGPQVGCR